jgi:hypothetical protein
MAWVEWGIEPPLALSACSTDECENQLFAEKLENFFFN